MIFQSGRTFIRSLPMMPRMGMNGTPFWPATRPASSAGQVASIRRNAPARTPSEKRGAPPASPSVTALVSIDPTSPSPISMSAWMPLMGTQTRWRFSGRLAMIAAVAAIATPAWSVGMASDMPSRTPRRQLLQGNDLSHGVLLRVLPGFSDGSPARGKLKERLTPNRSACHV